MERQLPILFKRCLARSINIVGAGGDKAVPFAKASIVFPLMLGAYMSFFSSAAQVEEQIDCRLRGVQCAPVFSERDLRVMAGGVSKESWRNPDYLHEDFSVAKPAGPNQILGTGSVTNVPSSQRVKAPKKRVDVFLEDAPLNVILNVVIYELFGTAFSIPPSVDATVTLRLNQDLTLVDVVQAINYALTGQDVSLKLVDGTVLAVSTSGRRGDRGVPLNSVAVIRAGADAPPTDAFIYETKFVPAKTLTSILEPLFGDNVFRSFDNERGLITLRGSVGTLKAAREVLAALDAPLLGGASFELLQLRYATSGDLIQQLKNFIDKTAVIDLIDLRANNAVLIVAKSAETLEQARQLLSIIDVPARPEDARRTLFYKAQHAEADHLKTVLQEFVGSGRDSNGSIAVDKNSGVIAITGPEFIRSQALDYLKLIDIAPKQISVEVTVVEVTLRDEFRFGIQWDALFGELQVTATDGIDAGLTTRFPGVSATYLGTDLSSVLHALDSRTEINVVSSPHILTYDRQKAMIQIGLEVPIISQSSQSVENPDAPRILSTQYRNTGVLLEVTPTIRGGNVIELDLSQEVSDVAESSALDSASPSFSQRKVESKFMVHSGTTIAIGGLLGMTDSNGKVGVPLLSRIPGIGRAFRADTRSTRKTELILLVRPQITAYVPQPRYVRSELEAAMEKAVDW